MSRDSINSQLTPCLPPPASHRSVSEVRPYASPIFANRRSTPRLYLCSQQDNVRSFSRAYYHYYGLQVTIRHCSYNYDPNHSPGNLILAVLLIFKEILLAFCADSQQPRNWLNVDDHCRAIDFVLCARCAGETYNIASGFEVETHHAYAYVCRIRRFSFLSPSSRRWLPGYPAE